MNRIITISREFGSGGRTIGKQVKWRDVHNYHITLNSGELGIDKCIEMIADLY